MIRIWTDGCCMKNPGGVGGWAWVAERNGRVFDYDSGGDRDTTNNVMELTAVIKALETYPQVEIISDSQYVVKGINVWIHNWKKRGWRRKGKGGVLLPVLNEDLWKQLDKLVAPSVIFSWVKGHNNVELNEMADRMARQAAERIGDADTRTA